MPLNALIAISGLIGLFLLIVAIRRFRVMNVGSGVFSTAVAFVFLALAAAVFALTLDLRTYQRLTSEAAVGELDLSRVEIGRAHV